MSSKQSGGCVTEQEMASLITVTEGSGKERMLNIGGESHDGDRSVGTVFIAALGPKKNCPKKTSDGFGLT